MRLLFVAGMLALAGTAFNAHAHPHDEGENPHACVPPGQWVLTKNGKAVTNEQAIGQLARQQAVLLGEDHDNPEHHRWQLQTLIQLYAHQPKMAIGFETFPRRVQPVLDRWVAGDYTEAEFLQAVDWDNVWSYDADFYLPMFHFARMYRIPMVAMNVNRDLVTRVGQEGWENIAAADREGLSDPAAAGKDYLELLATIFSRHSHGHGGSEESEEDQGPRFKRFVESQLVWDRAMAESMHGALQSKGTELVVAISGAGHIMGGYGIPHQLKDLGVSDIGAALPWGDNMYCDQLQADLADLVFGVDYSMQAEEQPGPKLGVFLEPAERGVAVRQVVEDSVAESLGIQEGDLIIRAAGRPIESMGDLIHIVQSTQFGTWLPLVIRRDGKEEALVAKFPPQEASR